MTRSNNHALVSGSSRPRLQRGCAFRQALEPSRLDLCRIRRIAPFIGSTSLAED
jgi:hypothetical protein